MKLLTQSEVHARTLEYLGLDSDALDLTSEESIACLIRRAAIYLCPCTSNALVQEVLRPLIGLVDDIANAKNSIESLVNALIAHGDLVELPEVSIDARFSNTKLLYATRPSFVMRKSGTSLLIGGPFDSLDSPLPQTLRSRINYCHHTRRIRQNQNEDLRSVLLRSGLVELHPDQWLRAPEQESATYHLTKMNERLEEAPPSGDVPGLKLLDSSKPIRYYPDRWSHLNQQTGRFVGRRSQAYGADLWCYVQVQEGYPQRLFDFPIDASELRGCDEAWRLQMAIDFLSGNPQRFRATKGIERTQLIEFFSPIPSWAQRRLDAIGFPVKTLHALLTYSLPTEETEQEVEFIRDRLWLTETQ